MRPYSRQTHTTRGETLGLTQTHAESHKERKKMSNNKCKWKQIVICADVVSGFLPASVLATGGGPCSV